MSFKLAKLFTLLAFLFPTELVFETIDLFVFPKITYRVEISKPKKLIIKINSLVI